MLVCLQTSLRLRGVFKPESLSGCIEYLLIAFEKLEIVVSTVSLKLGIVGFEHLSLLMSMYSLASVNL